MNPKTIAAAAALATLGSSAFAQTYVGIGAGATHACLRTDATGGCTKDAATVKAVVGYTWPGTDFAIEGIVDHLGTLKHDTSVARNEAKVDTFGIGGAWRPQFGAGWGGVLRAGIDYGQVRMTTNFLPVTSGTQPANYAHTNGSWQPYVGAGLTYAITSNLSLEADLDFNRVRAGSFGGATTATGLAIGLTFKF